MSTSRQCRHVIEVCKGTQRGKKNKKQGDGMRGFMKGQRMSDVGAFEDAHLRMTALENIFKKETEK